MQNPPRLPQIRGSFVASEGYELVEVDLSQAELRGLGALSGDEGLLEIYNSGGDLHDEVAISLFPGWHSERGGAKEQRVKAKNVNFGIPYGITKYGLQGQIGGTTIEAARMLQAWDDRFPVARAFLKKCRNAPLSNQDLTTCFGRRKRVGLVSRENMQFLQNEAANFPIQSISSDITLHAAIRTWEQLLSWGVKIVNLVHDSIIMEVPLVGELRLRGNIGELYYNNTVPIRVASIQLVANALRQVPIDYGITQVPFIADAEYGHRWGSLHKYTGDVYG
jgi:DNA polymerase-1